MITIKLSMINIIKIVKLVVVVVVDLFFGPFYLDFLDSSELYLNRKRINLNQKFGLILINYQNFGLDLTFHIDKLPKFWITFNN